MGTELMTGPFRYIVYVAQLFKKTEEDMTTLEGILTTLHNEISTRSSKRKTGESASEDYSLYGKDIGTASAKSKSLKISSLKVNPSNKMQIKLHAKQIIQTNVQKRSIVTNSIYSLNLDDHPHWLIRVLEFYVSISNAFADLRKYLKAACKEYAREMITCVRFYKQNAAISSENWEKAVEKALETLRQSCDKKIEGLISMLRVCEQQKSEISENKIKLMSEIEITSVEILCIKETTIKLLPTITMQEKLLETTNQKLEEIKKIFKKIEESYNMLKKTKAKLVKHNSRAATTRNTFSKELRMVSDKLIKSIANAQKEAEKIKLNELNEKGNKKDLISDKKSIKNKLISSQKKNRQAQKDLRKVLNEISKIKREAMSLEEEENNIVFTFQTACINSHKKHNDLKTSLANTIKKLQNILYISKLKTDDILHPIQSQIAAAKENYDRTSELLETIEENYLTACDRFDEVITTRSDLKKILENIESYLQELDINLLMLQNGFKKYVHKIAQPDESNCISTDLDDEVWYDVDIEDLDLENENDLILGNYLPEKEKLLLCLRNEEKILQESIIIKERENKCLTSSVIALGHAYISIMMFSSANSSLTKVPYASLLNDKNLGTSRMPDILMTGSCCSIDSALPQSHADEQSSKCSSRTRNKSKSKSWVKFENTLRKNLVSELRRVMKVK